MKSRRINIMISLIKVKVVGGRKNADFLRIQE